MALPGAFLSCILVKTGVMENGGHKKCWAKESFLVFKIFSIMREGRGRDGELKMTLLVTNQWCQPHLTVLIIVTAWGNRPRTDAAPWNWSTEMPVGSELAPGWGELLTPRPPSEAHSEPSPRTAIPAITLLTKRRHCRAG